VGRKALTRPSPNGRGGTVPTKNYDKQDEGFLNEKVTIRLLMRSSFGKQIDNKNTDDD
jgi:hypothetical protein